jgi:hypothetical protein
MLMDAARATVRVACLGLALLALPALAQTPDVAATCPDAMREGAELRKAPRQELASATRPALRNNLLLMARHDQEARAYLLSGHDRIDPATPEGARLAEVDARNLRRLKHIVALDGFPTAAMVGFDGVEAVLLLTTHAAADPDFQEQVLKLAAPYVRSGEVRADQVATLTDDLLRARGKKQRYGTQFEFHDGELRPAPIEDEANVDARRREVGLLSLANEVCLTRALFSAPARQ